MNYLDLVKELVRLDYNQKIIMKSINRLAKSGILTGGCLLLVLGILADHEVRLKKLEKEKVENLKKEWEKREENCGDEDGFDHQIYEDLA